MPLAARLLLLAVAAIGHLCRARVYLQWGKVGAACAWALRHALAGSSAPAGTPLAALRNTEVVQGWYATCTVGQLSWRLRKRGSARAAPEWQQGQEKPGVGGPRPRRVQRRPLLGSESCNGQGAWQLMAPGGRPPQPQRSPLHPLHPCLPRRRLRSWRRGSWRLRAPRRRWRSRTCWAATGACPRCWPAGLLACWAAGPLEVSAPAARLPACLHHCRPACPPASHTQVAPGCRPNTPAGGRAAAGAAAERAPAASGAHRLGAGQPGAAARPGGRRWVGGRARQLLLASRVCQPPCTRGSCRPACSCFREKGANLLRLATSQRRATPRQSPPPAPPPPSPPQAWWSATAAASGPRRATRPTPVGYFMSVNKQVGDRATDLLWRASSGQARAAGAGIRAGAVLCALRPSLDAHPTPRCRLTGSTPAPPGRRRRQRRRRRGQRGGSRAAAAAAAARARRPASVGLLGRMTAGSKRRR
jgi:hypothetical protein